MTLQNTKPCFFGYAVFWLITFDAILTHATMVRIVEKKTNPVARETSVNVVVKDAIGVNKDVVNNNKKVESNKGAEFRPLPFPVNFRYYDINKNGRITLRELIEVTGRAENVEKAFEASDLNDDGEVAEHEYSKMPWGYNQNDFVFKRG